MKLDRIFISHTHSDHVAELTLFIQMLHGASHGRTLEIYLPEEFVAPFEAYLPAVYLAPERLRLVLEIRGYDEGVVHSGDFRVAAIGNSHQAKLRTEMERLGLYCIRPIWEVSKTYGITSTALTMPLSKPRMSIYKRFLITPGSRTLARTSSLT